MLLSGGQNAFLVFRRNVRCITCVFFGFSELDGLTQAARPVRIDPHPGRTVVSLAYFTCVLKIHISRYVHVQCFYLMTHLYEKRTSIRQTAICSIDEALFCVDMHKLERIVLCTWYSIAQNALFVRVARTKSVYILKIYIHRDILL